MIIILKPRRHSRLWREEEKREEKTPLLRRGHPHFLGRSASSTERRGSSGPRLQKPAVRHRGAELSGGGSTSLTRPSILDLPRWTKPSSPQETALFASGGRAGARKTKGLCPLSEWCFVSRRCSVLWFVQLLQNPLSFVPFPKTLSLA